MARHRWCMLVIAVIVICAVAVVAYTQVPALWVLVGTVIIGMVVRFLCRS